MPAVKPEEKRPSATLLDLTRDLFTYLVRFRQQASSPNPPPLAQVRRELEAVFAGMEDAARAHPHLTGPYGQVRYALAALVDEIILDSEWKQAAQWGDDLLERRLYGTAEAGRRFFELAGGLKRAPQDVVAVYYLCLALGFHGQYTPRDSRLLAVKAELLARLPTQPKAPAPPPKPAPPAPPKPAPIVIRPAPVDIKPAPMASPPAPHPPPAPAPRPAPEAAAAPGFQAAWLGSRPRRFGLGHLVTGLTGLVAAAMVVLVAGPWLDPAPPPHRAIPPTPPAQVAPIEPPPAPAPNPQPSPPPAAAPPPAAKTMATAPAAAPTASAHEKTSSPAVELASAPTAAAPVEPSAPAAAAPARQAPPEPVAAPPVPATAPPAQAAPGSPPAERFVLQAGLYVGPIQSNRLAENLIQAGFAAWVVEKTRADGKVRYLVLVGPYAQKGEAQAAMGEIKKKVGVQPFFAEAE